VGDSNIISFVSFIQADGYNPLTVEGDLFECPLQPANQGNDESAHTAAKKILAMHHANHYGTTRKPKVGNVEDTELLDSVVALLSKPWRPGQMLLDLQSLGVELKRSDWPHVLVTASSAAVRVRVVFD
jgi:hypothetical protein